MHTSLCFCGLFSRKTGHESHTQHESVYADVTRVTACLSPLFLVALKAFQCSVFDASDSFGPNVSVLWFHFFESLFSLASHESFIDFTDCMSWGERRTVRIRKPARIESNVNVSRRCMHFCIWYPVRRRSWNIMDVELMIERTRRDRVFEWTNAEAGDACKWLLFPSLRTCGHRFLFVLHSVLLCTACMSQVATWVMALSHMKWGGYEKEMRRKCSSSSWFLCFSSLIRMFLWCRHRESDSCSSHQSALVWCTYSAYSDKLLAANLLKTGESD